MRVFLLPEIFSSGSFSNSPVNIPSIAVTVAGMMLSIPSGSNMPL